MRGAGRVDDALSAYRQAIREQPDNAEILASISSFLAQLQRFGEARSAHSQAAALMPEAGFTHLAMGEILRHEGDLAGAIESFRKAVLTDPKLYVGWNGLGIALRALGRFDEAAECFRRVKELRPDLVIGYSNLIGIGALDGEMREIGRLEELFNQEDLQPESRATAGFALGKAYDDAGQYDQAFACYARANSIARQMRATTGNVYDPSSARRAVDQIIESFSSQYFQKRRNWGEPTEVPVFIVGMPRSGTTLVQQIAASHPAVHGAGELSDIVRIAHGLGGADVKSAALSYNAGMIQGAARRHLQTLNAMGGTASRVIDKTPGNLYRLGLISLLFPSARIILCRREARDNCLSCYFQWFAAANTFSFDLAHCGHEYIATDRLIKHWRRVLGPEVLEIEYETLVADLEGESRRLIEFLKLPWDPACLEFHRAKTTVLTSSHWQVRQPIYLRSVGRWKHYEKHLGPLIQVLGS